MLRIAFSTLAARKGGMFGAFAAVALAVVLVVSCGILLESSLRAPIPVERLDAAAVVVQADPSFNGKAATSASCCRAQTRPGERSRSASSRCPALRRRRRPLRLAQVVDRADASSGATERRVGHGWPSAALTPFTLASGRAPRRGRRSCSTRVAPPATRPPRRPHARRDRHGAAELHGRRASRRPSRRTPAREAPVFFRDDVAADLRHRRPGRPDRHPLAAGADAQRRRDAVRAVALAASAGADGSEAGRGRSPDGGPQPRGHRRRADRLRRARGLRRDLRRREHVRALRPAAPPRARALPRDREHATAGAPHGRRRGAARSRCGGRASPLRSACSSRASSRACSPAPACCPRACTSSSAGCRSPAASSSRSSRRNSPHSPAPAARRASARPTRCASATSSDARSPGSRGLAGLAVLAGGVAVARSRRAAAARACAPAAAMIRMLAAALLGPLLALPFVWLLGLPLRRSAAGPACWRARTREPICAASPRSRRR